MIPLLLLPGMMCNARMYHHQIAQFSNERAVQFSPLSEHSDVQSLAEQVLRHAPSEFALCGLSMGGIVAMEVQRQAPLRVRGLALLDTNPLAELDQVKQVRTPQMEKVRQGRLLEVMRDEMKPNYLADNHNKAEILDLCAQMAQELGSDVFIRQSLALRERPDQSATLRSVRVPTLILCGDQDRLCPPERHRLMHELVSHSSLAIVADAGHLPVLEQPAETNAHLQAWLQACDYQH
ncbi:alpha/beta fold hydrolase [Granulosicoccus antarcticus]|uniref:Lipase 1 n=1 Tax=Granulosicoccus antarcticus IMCC3135 TaxID=1192854 RepID=A0A2Z2NZB5_9GAMM|nr:alpha/beta hydrolase [Granulosicoccus antarcticus]ASJ74220.1 Lipase 1 [Granulosicoccus antarcticus IMCC3135]